MTKLTITIEFDGENAMENAKIGMREIYKVVKDLRAANAVTGISKIGGEIEEDVINTDEPKQEDL